MLGTGGLAPVYHESMCIAGLVNQLGVGKLGFQMFWIFVGFFHDPFVVILAWLFVYTFVLLTTFVGVDA